MFYRYIITSLVVVAVCTQVVTPAFAQTVITSNGLYDGNNVSGQTIIVQDTMPTSTYIVQQPSQPVIVRNVETTYTTTYPVSDTIVAGVTGLIGGVLLGQLWHHHDKKHHYKPAPHSKGHKPHAHRPNKPTAGRHSSKHHR